MAQFEKADVESVNQKLQAFADGLPNQERNILAWVLSRSSGSELSDGDLEDVAGGAYDAEDSVSVGVTWSKS
jgi:hypothetical protein